jgi:hypothetical protein
MISILGVLTCVSSMVTQWLMAKVKLRGVYAMGILNGVLFTLLNGLMAMETPENLGVAALIVPSAWMIATSAIGLMRIHRFHRSLLNGAK